MHSRPTEGGSDAFRAASPLRFDLAELETFLAVLELGSFSLAARKLCISQPSVTNRVHRLEHAVGVKLLLRTTRHVEPTAEGSRLQEAAEPALRQLRELLKEFRDAAETGRRSVVVAATPMIATILPPVIQSFCRRYTDVQIRILDGSYEQLVTSLTAGTADLGIAVLDGDPGKFRFELLAEEEISLVVPSTHRLAGMPLVTIDDFVDFPIIMLARYATLRARLAEEYAKRGLEFQPLEPANLATLLGMLDAGMGISFFPHALVQSNAKRRRVAVQVGDLQFSRRYGIVMPRKGSLSAAAECFCRHLHAEFAKNLGADG